MTDEATIDDPVEFPGRFFFIVLYNYLRVLDIILIEKTSKNSVYTPQSANRKTLFVHQS
jgi:hypothetical protein